MDTAPFPVVEPTNGGMIYEVIDIEADFSIN